MISNQLCATQHALTFSLSRCFCVCAAALVLAPVLLCWRRCDGEGETCAIGERRMVFCGAGPPGEKRTCAIKCKPATISLLFSSLFAMHLSTCVTAESEFCGKVLGRLFLSDLFAMHLSTCAALEAHFCGKVLYGVGLRLVGEPGRWARARRCPPGRSHHASLLCGSAA